MRRGSFRIGGFAAVAVTTAIVLGAVACHRGPAPSGPASTRPSAASAPSSGGATAQGAPPPGLTLAETPQFVCVASDDNGFSGVPGSGIDGGLHYLTALFSNLRNPVGAGNEGTFDGVSPHFTFFVITQFIVPDRPVSAESSRYGRDNPFSIKQAWREAVDRGHEIAIHTHTHPHGRAFSVAQWEEEMRRSIEILTSPPDPGETPERPNAHSGLGVPRSALLGFRAPYIEPGDNGMTAAANLGLVYDSSIEEGPGLGPHFGGFAWPYRLDQGILANRPPIGRHPGLWEIPIGNYIVPPDGDCARYGVAPGLRARLQKVQAYFKPENGEITGMDWNLWSEFSMTPREFTATLEYTLDRHLAANRCPMTVGLHSELYTVRSGAPADAAEIRARRAALEEFFAYALAKPEVRFIDHRELLDWMRAPAPLR